MSVYSEGNWSVEFRAKIKYTLGARECGGEREVIITVSQPVGLPKVVKFMLPADEAARLVRLMNTGLWPAEE